MASRILNRRELRKESEQAEQIAAEVGEVSEAKPAKRAKANAPAAPRKRKPRAKKEPPRMRVRWGIFNNAAKQVAIFDYRERAAADKELAALLAKNKGLYYLQTVKEEMPEPLPEPPAA